MIHFAEVISQYPVASQIDEQILVDAEDANAEVGDRQICQEEVRNGAQTATERDDKYDEQVAEKTQAEHDAVQGDEDDAHVGVIVNEFFITDAVKQRICSDVYSFVGFRGDGAASCERYCQCHIGNLQTFNWKTI